MFKNKSILITGGTGSFGHALVSKLLSNNKKIQIFILSRDELKQFEMNNFFQNDNRLNFILGDVRDNQRISSLNINPNFVVHAAAMKQIVASEMNPSECINTNILGTQNILKFSLSLKNCNFLSLSSDKAVNPINLYGSTKLSLEKLTLATNNISNKNNYSVLRYGNVIGSRGSVIPFFKNLKLLKKSIPVTHKDMTRFWITLEQAADLSIKCLKIMQGNEIFIPKLPSFKILDLAKLFSDKIVYTGIRKGEKLHEVLIAKEEKRNCFFSKKHNIFIIKDTNNKSLKLNRDNFIKINNNYTDYDSCANEEVLSISKLKKII